MSILAKVDSMRVVPPGRVDGRQRRARHRRVSLVECRGDSGQLEGDTKIRRKDGRVDGIGRSNRGGVGDGVVRVLVSLSTEALRLLGVGSGTDAAAQIPESEASVAGLPPSSLPEFMEKLADDYERMYFVTGDLADELYVANCRFADPTISFEGLELYKSNLRLLIPFLVSPDVRLKGMEVVDGAEFGEGRSKVRAAWTLETGLKLPWKPRIYVHGTTDYDLIDFQVVQHVERWDISAPQAVLMVLGLFQR